MSSAASVSAVMSPTDMYDEIRTAIQDALIVHQTSQAAVCKACNIPAPTLSRFLSNKRGIELDNLLTILSHLGITLKCW